MKLEKIFGNDVRKGAFLAPIAGFSDFAFRSICAEYGAISTTTEMVSAKAIDFKNQKTQILYYKKDIGIPQGIQIFGNDPIIMSRVVKDVINPLGFDFIDINMACPVPKIFKNREGSYLMTDTKLASQIVSGIVEVSEVPVSVKIRLGINKSSMNAGEFAKAMEEAGASFVILHGRTREMYYSGNAMIDEIAKVKENLNIPLIANGDIFSPEDAKRVLEESKSDAIMLARGAIGAPWIFEQIRDYFETGTYQKAPELEKRIELIRIQYEMMKEYKPQKVALLEMRKHFAAYLKGIAGSSKAKVAVNSCKNEEEFYEVLDRIQKKS